MIFVGGDFMIKAVIMAGGKGTRIRPLTIIRPKPMVPVVNRPLIDYVIETIKNSGCKESNYNPKLFSKPYKIPS
jgi:NDP-sugar pyrophosphorylase family protein